MMRKQSDTSKAKLPPKYEASRTLPPIRSLNSTEERSSNLFARSSTVIEETKQSEQEENQPSRGGRVKLPIYPNLNNMLEFRKKHRLDPKTKVYIVTNGYGDIKRALDKRGWVQNPDLKSLCFDLKWTIKSNEEEIPHLEDFQLVNHFEKNSTITTKVGLCRNLRNLIWFCNVDIDSFYPKCFDLSDEKDYDDFLEDFKYTKAESILKLYAKISKEGEARIAKEMEETVLVAIQVCEKKLVDMDDVLEKQGEIQPVKITDEEWKILSQDEISPEALAKKKFEERLSKLDPNNKPKKAIKKKAKKTIIDVKALSTLKDLSPKVATIEDQGEESKNPDEDNDEVIEKVEKNEILEKVEEILMRLKEKNPQDGLIGDKNIWILKPAGLSRGRGITCVRNLAEVTDVARKNANHWVVQKYIENPLIVHKRKFDIRQWVLVTDWNPLTIWFYEECYVRFSGDEYNVDDLENRFVHLTNNSVVKHMKEGNDDPTFEQNMWRMETFISHLQERFGSDVFNEAIKPKLKQIVIWALESVQDMVGNRKNSFELYGYDFMIDEDFNVWLIEINLSPAMDYSTPVTKRLVKMVSEDLVKVVVDYGMSKKKKKKSEIDTGLFTRIHKSKRCVDKNPNSFGLDFVCEGFAVQRPEKY